VDQPFGRQPQNYILIEKVWDKTTQKYFSNELDYVQRVSKRQAERLAIRLRDPWSIDNQMDQEDVKDFK
jgi:hypothetical protein